MPRQRPPQKQPILLAEPDREENLAKAKLLIAQQWEGLSGPPMTPNALSSWALSLLEIAEDWPKAELLVKEIRTGCERRPAPIEMRRFYCEQIGDPADGISDSWADLGQFMGSGFKKKVTGE